MTRATFTELKEISNRPTALVLGAEGPGLQFRTKETVDLLAKFLFQPILVH